MNSKPILVSLSFYVFVSLSGCGGSGAHTPTSTAPQSAIATVYGGDFSSNGDIDAMTLSSDGTVTSFTTPSFTILDPPVAVTVVPSAGLLYVAGQARAAFTGGSVSLLKISTGGHLSATSAPIIFSVDQPESMSTTSSGDLLLVNRNGGGSSIYRVDTTGGTAALIGGFFTNGPAAISGDGRFIFAVDGSNFNSYVLNQVSGSITLATSIIDSVFGGQPTPILVDPSGKFVYEPISKGSFSPAGIAGFSVAADGTLTPIPGSPFASDLSFGSAAGPVFSAAVIDPSGTHLYAEAAPFVYAFSIDQTTGALSPISGAFPFSSVHPFGLTIDPSGQFLLISNLDSVFSYSLASDGAPTLTRNSPFSAGHELTSMVSVR